MVCYISCFGFMWFLTLNFLDQVVKNIVMDLYSEGAVKCPLQNINAGGCSTCNLFKFFRNDLVVLLFILLESAVI